MTLTHIFFDLHGTLVDNKSVLTPCYAANLGHVMAARYGGDPHTWEQAHQQINADWFSYFVDLNLDEDIDDMWEGLFRTTRALFRLTGTPEPSAAEIHALVRELPGLASENCDAFFPDARATVQTLHEAGYTLGVCTHGIVRQAQGTLHGAGVRDYFSGPLIGPDVTGHFRKHEGYFTIAALRAGVDPAHCLMIDDTVDNLEGAKAIGMKTIYICRDARPAAALNYVDALLHPDLTGLPALVEGWR